jgi:tRNA threonylcarbamoyladenosine biosynthesis protein TsaE
VVRLAVASPADMEALGARLARAIAGSGGVVFLSGDLGAGKTTLVRGLLRALGHRGSVKSPTFTLVEPYVLGGEGASLTVNHFDLYRLEGGADLEGLGFRDYLEGSALCLIEWPERAAGSGLRPDLEVRIEILDPGREVEIDARSPWGSTVLAKLT